MSQVTIVSDEVRVVEARVDDDRILIDPGLLTDALGWELKAEGLCRDDICVPVTDSRALFRGGELDLAAVAAALGRPLIVDAESGIAAMALDAGQRQLALESLEAPDFALDDLDGGRHRLADWHGKKRLLVAFASW
jgi:hypothetical protein